MIKVGADIHGVIDKFPEQFSRWTKELFSHGAEIHIITGQEWDKVVHVVEAADIKYTHHFSIVDYHKSIGTKMWQDERGRWQMGDVEWDRSKGDYIHREKVDIHFDDNWEYANYIPDFCTFILVPKKGFHNFSFFINYSD